MPFPLFIQDVTIVNTLMRVRALIYSHTYLHARIHTYTHTHRNTDAQAHVHTFANALTVLWNKLQPVVSVVVEASDAVFISSV